MNLTEKQIEDLAERANDTNWWEINDNIVITARWMADNLQSASDVAYLIEPWKFSQEYVQAEADLRDES